MVQPARCSPHGAAAAPAQRPSPASAGGCGCSAAWNSPLIRSPHSPLCVWACRQPRIEYVGRAPRRGGAAPTAGATAAAVKPEAAAEPPPQMDEEGLLTLLRLLRLGQVGPASARMLRRCNVFVSHRTCVR